MTRPKIVAISARIAAVRLAVPGALYRLPAPILWELDPLDCSQPARRGTTDLAVTLFHDLTPAQGYRLAAEGFDPIEFHTRPCAGLVEAEDFGLVEGAETGDIDAAALNARVLAEALGRVPAGGTLRLGPGNWVALPLRMRAHTTLHLAEGATLRAPSERRGWPIIPARDEQGDMLGSWEGLPAACFAAPLHAIGATSLAVEGRGTIDGSGSDADWWTWPKETRDGARRPRGMHFIRCTDVMLMGFTIRNAPSWTIHPQACAGFRAAGLSIEAPHNSPNTDGLNPDGCRDVALEGIRFSVGDDCIAIKAGKRGHKGECDHLQETRGVEIRNCLMESGHGGVVIGSEMSGGVHDVTVEDCEMIGTDRGLRLKTRRGRGGAITGVAMRRVRMKGVLTALSANSHYHCDADGHAEHVQTRSPMPVVVGTPTIDGITVEDVEILSLSHAAGVFLGLPERPIRNVRIRRLRLRSTDPDAAAAPPIMADHVRPMRHEAILAEHAEVVCDDPDLLSSAPVSMTPSRAQP